MSKEKKSLKEVSDAAANKCENGVSGPGVGAGEVQGERIETGGDSVLDVSCSFGGGHAAYLCINFQSYHNYILPG
jgi:hypothetical protein